MHGFILSYYNIYDTECFSENLIKPNFLKLKLITGCVRL